MIYTVTFNPSLDYMVSMDEFRMGMVNRTSGELLFPGGKGINVSMVLKNLGMESTALGFIAGFTGEEIERLLKEKGILTELLPLQNGFSRINVKIRGKQETEINGQGPSIGEKDIEQLYRRLDDLEDKDILVLAGSIPASMPGTIYRDILEYLKEKDLKIVVDATRDLLRHVLPLHPFLIKPNHHELGEMFGVTIVSREMAAVYAKKLQDQGARNVLVSMAGEGAVLVTKEGTVYMSGAPEGMVVNSVGAGDSMVAGFLYGYLQNEDLKEAFRYGLCTGSASAFTEGLVTKEAVLELMKEAGDVVSL